MSKKLKPCPFCGGKVRVLLIDNTLVDGVYYTVSRGNSKKNNCHCRLFFESELIPRGSSKLAKRAVFNDLAEAWNRRVNDEKID